MNYNEAMSYIKEVGNFGSNYGLERTYRILELLDNPQDKIKIVHVAGTNGKGSVTSMITSLLMEAGFKVGMYTSPFIEEFEERIQINRNNIPKDKLAFYISEVKKAVDKVIEEGYSHPTEFEIITCLMYLYFCKENVDYAVVEVGLGGRLDSTNVINPVISVITSISFDHINLLGNTLGEIASEKAGIIKKDTPVVIYPQEEEAFISIENAAKKMNANIIEVNTNNARFVELINEEKVYQRVVLNIDNQEYLIDLPLLGKHQINNLLVAVTAFINVCKINNISYSEKLIYNAIKKVVWIARMEILKKEPLVVIDGAHNIQGIKALRYNVENYLKYKNIYLLLGILADKQVNEMIKEIAPIAKKVYALTPHNDRAELSEDLRKEIIKINPNCIAYESYKEAYINALEEADKEDLILISGSLYMVGDMRKIIRRYEV